MAGYVDFSKSVNAVEAENCGLFPASAIERQLKLPAGFVKKHLGHDEWHHTGKYYKRTDYYLLDSVAEFINSQDGQVALDAFRKGQRTKQCVELTDCTVEWIEWDKRWVGRRGRKWVPDECSASRCTVIITGSTCKITFSNGQTLLKRFGTNGFYLRSLDNCLINSYDDAVRFIQQQNRPILHP